VSAIDTLALERFAAIYVETADGHSAAAHAGLDREQIVEAIQSQVVQHAISNQSDRQELQALRADEVRAEVWRLLRKPIGDVDAARVRLGAAKLLLQSYGGLVHRVQVSAKVPAVRRGFTDAEVRMIRAHGLGGKPARVIQIEAKKAGTQ
jgi:hypothetical protein